MGAQRDVARVERGRWVLVFEEFENDRRFVDDEVVVDQYRDLSSGIHAIDIRVIDYDVLRACWFNAAAISSNSGSNGMSCGVYLGE